ncbi:MAG: sulfatase-like hydrolase/transferase [Chloroflexi bacterium]|nr:sulfatase-like hydrolase/transferase [Chloroflexota bacterium]
MPDRPNILVFLTDDHGQWASSAYGNSEIHSPTMQFLADSGARMAHAFTPCPVCSPARASFFTGCIPSAHGIHDYIQETPGCERRPHSIMGQSTIAARLKETGYETALCGKWHCGHWWEQHPGFDTWFTSAVGTNARFTEHEFFDGKGEVHAHGYQAPVYTDRALQFLRQHDTAAPFFLVVGYTDTHSPHAHAPERLVAGYRDCSFRDIPDETHDPETHGHARSPKPEAEAHRAALADYYASVSMIDEQMGRIIDELKSRQLLDNTLVVYTSDHGHMNGHHGLYYKGNTTVPQNFLDESIHVPCLLRWPGTVLPGIVHDELVDHCDLHATLLDAAGIGTPSPRGDEAPSPGRSYLPILRGEQSNWRNTQFCEYGNARMARTATLKYIRRWHGANRQFGDELYDLAADPRETRNVITDPAYGKDVGRLSAGIDAYFSAHEVPEHSGLRVLDMDPFNNAMPWANGPEAAGH